MVPGDGAAEGLSLVEVGKGRLADDVFCHGFYHGGDELVEREGLDIGLVDEGLAVVVLAQGDTNVTKDY